MQNEPRGFSGQGARKCRDDLSFGQQRRILIKSVFITGGSRGIGKALVESFSDSQDHRIAFTYATQESAAHAVADACRVKGTDCLALQMDLSNKTSIHQAIERALEWSKTFDIVIHNAAVTADAPFYFLEEEDWDRVTQVSLNSFFYLNKAFLPGMISQRWGRVVTLASVSGEAGQRGQTNYAAAKGALISATKSLSKELAKKGVLANVVSPGLVETDMTAELDQDHILPLIPVGRFARPQEVAHAVRFLCSEEASYICGTVLQVNGGLYT